MTISLGRAAGLLAFAFPAIFWEDTELGFRRMEAAGVEVPSTSHQGPTCQMRDPHSEPALPRGSKRQPQPASLNLGAAAPFWCPRARLFCSHHWASQSLSFSFGNGGAGNKDEVTNEGEFCLCGRVIIFHLPTELVS